jgi:hypothetical protein
MSSELSVDLMKQRKQSKEGSAWLAIVAVAGFSVAAAFLIKRRIEGSANPVNDLVDNCEKALKTLDARLSDWAVAAS